MKKIYLIVLMYLIVQADVFAQQVILNFETDSTSTVFQYFGSGLDGQLNKVVNNPASGGINTSAKVAEFVKPADAQVWAGAFSNPNPKKPVNLTANGSMVCVKVWMERVGSISLKLEASSTGGADWIQTLPVSKAKEWVELCFDPKLPGLEGEKKPAAGQVYARVVLFFDFGKTGAESAATSYFDDVQTTVSTAPTTANVTFAVDMKSYTKAFNTVFVSGTFNNWSADSNPLQDADKDGIWTATLPIPAGAIEYKFQVDQWKDQESFRGTETCTATTPDGQFTNRYKVIPSAGLVLDTVCWSSCYACGASVLITVNLGTQHIPVAATGVFIAGGGNFGAPGNFPLRDPDKDGVYSITFERPKGFTSFYTFTNGNCPDYSCKENIAGQACANPDNFNDRKMGPFTKDTVLNTCFERCTDNTNCGALVKRKVTFRVNMAAYKSSFVNVYLSGSFNNWSANANILKDDDLDNIWTTTVELNEGTYEYKFQLDGWSAQENFVGGESCTKTTGAFTNRITTVSADSILPVVCFNACTACAPTSVNSLERVDYLFRVSPNPANNEVLLQFNEVLDGAVEWQLYDMLGRVQAGSRQVSSLETARVSVAELPAGMYWVLVRNGRQIDAKKLVVQH